MHHKRTLYIEKLQVLGTLGLLLAAVYFWLWRWFEPADPLGPMTMLATGHVGRFALLAILVWVMTAIASLTTLFSRPGGAVTVGLLAGSGLAMRSASLRPLLWQGDISITGLYASMLGEVLAFAVILFGAEIIAMALQSALHRVWPGVAWQDPTSDFTEAQRAYLAKEKMHPEGAGQPLGMTYTLEFWAALRETLTGSKEAKSSEGPGPWRQAALCGAAGALAAVVLTVILMASDARGQIGFAVFAACLLGSMIGQHLFPSRLVTATLAMPLVVAMLFYVLAMLSVQAGQTPRPQFQILPVDWLTFGCGGAMLGLWFSGRMRQARMFDKLAEAE